MPRDSEDQRLLAESAEGWLRRHYGFAERAVLLAAHEGRPTPIWAEFAAMGWLGAGPAELAPLMREFGRALVVEPFLATVLLGAGLLARCDAAPDMIDAVTEGSLQLALAYAEPDSGEEPCDVTTLARLHPDGGWRIEGHKTFVLNGDAADTLLVTARLAGGRRDRHGVGLFALPRGAPGCRVTGYRCFDGNRAAEVALQDCRLPPEALLCRDALAPLERTIEDTIAAVLSEAVGVMEAAHALTTRHLQARRQFGRPLAEFQVLRHRLVDMWVALEEARSMARYAADAVDWQDALARGRAVAAAKVCVAGAGRLIGQQAIQLHGAIGLTDEYAAGHQAKRLEAIATLFGDADHHLARYDQAAAL